MAGGQVARLYSVQSGHSVTLQFQFGNQVPSDLALETFRATSSDLLATQIHDSNGQYLDQPISTASMQIVDQKSIANGGSITVTQPDGIYLLLAADASGQYGAMWLDVSKYGVVLRQDDQKIVVAGQDLTSGATTPTFQITFFNLQGGVQSVISGSFSGTGEFAANYPAPIDVAVATSGGEDVIIPVSAPQTNADIKVVGNLSTQPQIFLTTDRAGYQKGDTVNFGGVLRLSNDQAYTIPNGMSVAVWSGYGQSKLVKQTAPVAADGTFGGSFVMPDAAFNADGTDAQMNLYAGTPAEMASDNSPFFTVVDAIGSNSPAARITVSFDKATYVASDSITASIAGVDGTGKALAAKSTALTIYFTDHAARPSEMDSFATPSTWGLPVGQADVPVVLDANGHATYTFKANLAQKAADEEVTLVATYGTGVAEALGARSAIVYQAADEVFMLPSRTVYEPGDSVIAPFVVETLAGQRVANMPVVYQFDQTSYQGSTATTTAVASGGLTTDANGLGTVRTVYSGPTGAVVLRIKGKDAAGNTFEDARPMTVTSDPASLVSFGPTDTLTQLSVTTDKIAYSSGDTAHLTITAPAAETVLLSLERGRIHQYRWLTLTQGDNQLALLISPDLGPGFTATFSYFRNGAYTTEGLPISVNNSTRLIKVTATPDHASYTAGQTAHVSVTVTDSTGAPVAASLLIDGFDASMSQYKLVDQGSIAGAFFSPAARGTNGSSSLVGIGSWGGRCGGGGMGPQPAVTNPGRTAVWFTDVTTDASGHATVDVPVGQGPVRLVLIASSATTSVGQTQMDLNVQ